MNGSEVKKINILHTIDCDDPGGAQQVFIDVVRLIDSNKYNSVVVVTGEGWLYQQLVGLGFQPLVVKAKGSFNISYLVDLYHLVKERKIDLIHSHLLGSNVYCSLVGVITKVPVISTFHGFVDVGQKERLLGTKFGIINKGSRVVVNVSNSLTEYLSGISSLSKDICKTIYNGIDVDRYSKSRSYKLRQELNLSDENILVGAIGYIRPPKSYDTFIDAAELLVKRFDFFRFVIVGDGEEELKEKLLISIREKGLSNHFFLVGARNNIDEIIGDLDIFTLTSTSEGFSLSTIEAMAAKVPVVVTACGGPEEIIEDGRNGLLVPTKDAEALSKALATVHTDQELTQTLIQVAFTETQERFSLDKTVSSYEQLYDWCALG